MKSFFARIWKSCFSPKSYSEILRQSFGKSLGYITLLILIYVLIFSFFLNLGGLRFANEAMDWIEENFPAITVKDGKISSDVRQPYVREFDGFAFIIDTTGRIKKISDKYKYGILVAKDQVFFKRDENRTEVYDVPTGEEELYIDASLINTFIKIGRHFIFPVIFIFVFAFYWVVILIKIFFYSLASLLFNVIFSAKLQYGSLLNIGVHALTLPFLLSIVIEHLGIPISGLIYNHLLYLILLGVIIYQNRKVTA